MKNKKHWNSFTSGLLLTFTHCSLHHLLRVDFFISIKDTMSKLDKHAVVAIDKGKYDGMLKDELRCHRCRV